RRKKNCVRRDEIISGRQRHAEADARRDDCKQLLAKRNRIGKPRRYVQADQGGTRRRRLKGERLARIAWIEDKLRRLNRADWLSRERWLNRYRLRSGPQHRIHVIKARERHQPRLIGNWRGQRRDRTQL